MIKTILILIAFINPSCAVVEACDVDTSFEESIQAECDKKWFKCLPEEVGK